MGLIHFFLSSFLIGSVNAEENTCTRSNQILPDNYYLKFDWARTSIWKKELKTDKKILKVSDSSCGEFLEFETADIDGDKKFDLLMIHENEDQGGMSIWLNKKSWMS